MNMELSRRGFLKVAGAGVAGTSLGARGGGEAPTLIGGAFPR
jgi:formate dehydrogenase major subunit